MRLLDSSLEAKRSTAHVVKRVANDVIVEEWERIVEIGAKELKMGKMIGTRARG